MEIQGKAAIVTGGATGLGRAISLALAAAGANVGIIYSRSEREATETAERCTALGPRAIAVRADVAVEADVRAMVEDVHRAFGRIDVLVNDAGTTVFRPMSDLDSITEAEWDRIMAVNVKGAWFTSRAAAPYMRAQGAGAIVNITSIAGLRPSGSSLPYCVSKAGAIMLTKCLAVGLAPTIRVNSVAPGLLRTRWMAGFPEAQVQEYERAALLQRATPLEDVVRGVMLAIENDSMTGQTIVIDSGLHLH